MSPIFQRSNLSTIYLEPRGVWFSKSSCLESPFFHGCFRIFNDYRSGLGQLDILMCDLSLFFGFPFPFFLFLSISRNGCFCFFVRRRYLCTTTAGKWRGNAGNFIGSFFLIFSFSFSSFRHTPCLKELPDFSRDGSSFLLFLCFFFFLLLTPFLGVSARVGFPR